MNPYIDDMHWLFYEFKLGMRYHLEMMYLFGVGFHIGVLDHTGIEHNSFELYYDRYIFGITTVLLRTTMTM